MSQSAMYLILLYSGFDIFSIKYKNILTGGMMMSRNEPDQINVNYKFGFCFGKEKTRFH